MKFLLLLIFSFNSFAQTFNQAYIDPYGQEAQVPLRQEAVDWVNRFVEGLEFIQGKETGLYYITSLFYNRLQTIEARRPQYDEIYAGLKKGDVSFSPFFVKDGIKIKILGNHEHVTDLPEYAHWRGKTVEEVFGYPGDHRLMDDVGGEATRNTCLLKAHRVGTYPVGSTNVYYHEFGHFLHMTTMTPAEFWKIEQFYLKAKERNLFLDSYAAVSVHEYFAQGLEAYISVTKTASDRRGEFTKSDRAALLKKDPELHDFIASLIEEY